MPGIGNTNLVADGIALGRALSHADQADCFRVACQHDLRKYSQ